MCHARCSRIQCQLVPRETIGNCAKISMSDQRAGRAITIGWDAGEARRLIVPVCNSAMVVAGTSPALWRPRVIACSALRRIVIGNPTFGLSIMPAIHRNHLEIEHWCHPFKMILHQLLQFFQRRAVLKILMGIRIAGKLLEYAERLERIAPDAPGLAGLIQDLRRQAAKPIAQ